jgi:hypothetical protein
MRLTITTWKGNVMGRSNYGHSVPLLVFLAALALIGVPFVEFLFVAAVAIGIGAVLLYTFLGFAYIVDRIIDHFYKAR